jgi:hypothetical protein
MILVHDKQWQWQVERQVRSAFRYSEISENVKGNTHRAFLLTKSIRIRCALVNKSQISGEVIAISVLF